MVQPPVTDAKPPQGNETIWKVIRDARTELGLSAGAIALIYAIVSLSGSAIVGAIFKVINSGTIGADDTLNLFNILLLTAPLTLALAIIFGADMKGAFEGKSGPAVILTITAVVVGLAFLFGKIEYQAPPTTGQTSIGSLLAEKPVYTDQGVSLDRAIQEMNKNASHPVAKVLFLLFIMVGFYISSFGAAAFLAAFVLGFQLARFGVVYWPRLQSATWTADMQA